MTLLRSKGVKKHEKFDILLDILFCAASCCPNIDRQEMLQKNDVNMAVEQASV
jgi:hypothetical protein